jgi:hypothetical protein
MSRNACQMVMQGAALVVRIICAMIVLAARATAIIVVSMVVVDMVGDANGGKILGNILLTRENVLEMGASQRCDPGDLGHKKQPQQPRTNSAHFEQ